MAKDHVPNDLLRGFRERLFGTQQAMADAGNKHLAPAYLLTGNDIGKLERGVVDRPSPPRCAALRTVCGVATDAEIGLVRRPSSNANHAGSAGQGPPDDSDSTAMQVLGGREGQAEPIGRVPTPGLDARRRHGRLPQATDTLPTTLILDVLPDPALTGECATGTAGHGSFGNPAYAGAVERIIYTALDTRTYARNAGANAMPDTVIERLSCEITDLARDYGHRTPSAAAVEALGLHDRARDIVDRTGRPRQQMDLFLALAQSSALLASACIDLGLWSTAQHYAAAAYDYGDGIGHTGALAYALGMQATIAYWTGQINDAVADAQAAVRVAPAGLATVRAHSILARAWAHRGATDEVEGALHAARVARADDGSDALHDPVGGEFGWSLPQHERCESTAWLQVGRPVEASAAVTRAIELIDTLPDDAREPLEAEVRVDLATCHVLRGRPDEAQAALTPAVDALAPLWATPQDSRRIGLLGRMDRLGSLLAAPKWHGVGEAQNLLDMVRAFSEARPSAPALPAL